MTKRARSTFRLANVGFLNATPYRAVKSIPWIEYSEHDPAECARALHEQECDLACVPLVEYLAGGSYLSLDYGIAANGAVQSVLLLAEREVTELDTVFVDNGTQAAFALLRVMLPKICGTAHASRIAFHRMERNEAVSRVGGTVGALIIGDLALRDRERFSHVVDLAELWRLETGLPFVFGIWAGRTIQRDAVWSAEQLSEISRKFELGIDQREIYAREWADTNRFNRETAEDYVNNRILYRLDDNAHRGIEEFTRLGIQAGILPRSATHRMDRQSDALVITPSALRSPKVRLSLTDGITIAEKMSFSDLAPLAAYRERERQESIAVIPVTESAGGALRPPNDVLASIAALEKEYTQLRLLGAPVDDLGFRCFVELIQAIRKENCKVLTALSADEILSLVQTTYRSLEDVLEQLASAGLQQLSGDRAGILVDRFRRRGVHGLSSSADWLLVHRTAHRVGLQSEAAITIGNGEGWSDRIVHLYKLRQLQDETKGFTTLRADITPSFWNDPQCTENYLRTIALARLVADNIAVIVSSAEAERLELGELAKAFGLLASTSDAIDENIVDPVAERSVANVG